MNQYDSEPLHQIEPDYLAQYGLHSAPFSPNYDPKFLFQDAERQQRLNLLNHMVQYSDLLLLVMGERGVGKTTLATRFVEKALDNWHICQIAANTMMDAGQLLFQAAQGFGLTQLPHNTDELQEMLYARVATIHHNEAVPILIIDDAHELPKDALHAIFHLADVQGGEGNLFRIILFCEPQIEKILAVKEIKSLRERVTHTLEIPALDEDETAEYIKHRMAVAGFIGETPFTPRLVKKIHKQSNGVIAEINKLAHIALDEASIPVVDDIVSDVRIVAGNERAEEYGLIKQGTKTSHIIFIASLALLVTAILVFQDSVNSWLEEDDTAQQSRQQAPAIGTKENITADTPTRKPPQPADKRKLIVMEIPDKPQAAATKPGSADEQIATAEKPADSQTTNPVTEPVVKAKIPATAENTAVETTAQPIKLQLTNITPDPVQARNAKQRIVLNGQGFRKQSQVAVTWSNKHKVLSKQQVEFISAQQLAININVGVRPETWAVRVTDDQRGESNKITFNVRQVEKALTGTQDQQWVLKQNPAQFTLQLFGTHTEAGVKKFIHDNKLSGEVAYFYNKKGQNHWFSVIYGRYPDQEQARQAIEKLPASIVRAKPWIRRFESVHTAIKASPKYVPTVAQKASAGTGNQNEAWLWSQDPRHFTLQLLGARHSGSIQKFIKQHNLRDKAVYFHTRHNKQDWYTVVYGVYADRNKAQQAIKQLPVKLKDSSPWIRSFASIHAEMDRADAGE